MCQRVWHTIPWSEWKLEQSGQLPVLGSGGVLTVPAVGVATAADAVAAAAAIDWAKHWELLEETINQFNASPLIPKTGGKWTGEPGNSGWISESWLLESDWGCSGSIQGTLP